MFKANISKKHVHVINAEHADQTGCPDLAAVQQLEQLGALIEVVAQWDAVAPALDLPALGPELEVNGVPRLEHLAKRANVDGLCHGLIGMQDQILR